ncbi:MAG: RNA polymerase sigma factor [Oscillospiraceae bacterium]|nr:RNA polymerase sigma factor [Oscillospiraceae bacterium]
MDQTIAELVLQARQGEQDAFSELYRQTYNSVYQSIRALVKDEDAAQDLVHDSYIKGFQNLDKLDDPAKFTAWMKRLASNTALDYLKKKRPALFSERVDENGEEIDLRHADADLSHQPDAVLDRQETTRLMNAILDTLSPEQRLALSMLYYEERSIREIAAVMNCSENTVKSRLNYGRKKVEAAVLALEKQGVKLYSMAPMPFLLWLFRTAKAQGISAQAVAGIGAAASGASAGASAGSTAAANAAATAATKTAGTAAAKTLATKIVAGALAVTIAAGTGAVIHHAVKERQEPQTEQVGHPPDPREQAMHHYYHIAIWYRDAFRRPDAWSEGYEQYWSYVAELLQTEAPDRASADRSWDLDYSRHYRDCELTSVSDGKGILLSAQDSSFGNWPELDKQKIFSTTLEGEEIRCACEDLDGDGVEEFIVARFYRGEPDRSCSIDVYAFRGDLQRGEAVWEWTEDGYIWKLCPAQITEHTEIGPVTILSGGGHFGSGLVIPEPDLDWRTLYAVGLDTGDIPSGFPDTIFDYDPHDIFP